MPVKHASNTNGNGVERDETGRWKSSGNPNGRPKAGTSIRELMSLRLDRNAFVDKVIELAMEGNPTALREVLERLDGKIAQGLVGGDGESLISAITVDFVKSSNSDS